MCQQELKLGVAPEEGVYVSPDAEQGKRDAEAFTSYNDISLTMQ